MILYPRLSRDSGLESLAAELSSKSIDECRSRRQTSHSNAEYSATGGVRASVSHLESIAKGLTDIAQKHGYPEDKSRRHTAVDAEWAEFLHRHLKANPHEAALDGMWHFMTCILVPDLVRWRWGTSKENSVSDRWITMSHRGRNCFGRLWWRSEILQDGEGEGRYHLVRTLGEDELVQIMERPVLAGNRLLSRTTAKELLRVYKANPRINRAQILREYQKRILRLGAFIEFHLLDEKTTGRLVGEVFIRTLDSFRKAGGRKREGGEAKGTSLLERTL